MPELKGVLRMGRAKSYMGMLHTIYMWPSYGIVPCTCDTVEWKGDRDFLKVELLCGMSYL